MRALWLTVLVFTACHKTPTRAHVAYDRLGKLELCTRQHLGRHRGESVDSAKAACLVSMITADDDTHR